MNQTDLTMGIALIQAEWQNRVKKNRIEQFCSKNVLRMGMIGMDERKEWTIFLRFNVKALAISSLHLRYQQGNNL